nr:MAG TPA: hypothetical protein [Caudoviricetes sp.]
MADAILMAGGTGGVSSDDVTAGKAQVLQGYKTVTTDSDDEIIEGTMVNRGNGMVTVEFGDAYWESKYFARMEQGYYAQVDQWKPYVSIPYAVLANGIHLDANKMLDTLTVAGVKGTIPVRGYHGPDSTEMWYYPQESGYVIRIEEGYYHKGGQWKPYVLASPSLVKSAVNYHPEKTLSDTRTCEEQGQIKMVDTKLNNYTNNQARNIGIDGGRGKLWMELGHGNAYYYRDDNVPHVETDASKLGTAGADAVLQWQTATSQHGVKFEGTIPRWICNTGDIISSLNGEGFAWDDGYAGRGRGIVSKIPNGHFIQGANYVFLASPNLQPWNIRQNVNVNGVVGTMVDYGAGGQAFREATFDSRLLTGVANKGFILNSIGRYLNLKNINYGYQGIVDGGLKFINGYSGNTHVKTAPDIGCVFANSVNLTPFRYIKMGFKFIEFRGDGTGAQPARIELEVGATPTSGAGGETYHNESNTVVRDVGGRSKFAIYTMTSTRVNVGNISDQSQQHLTLDVSASQGHHFIYIMLGNIVHEYSGGSVYAVVVVNNIEFIN